MICEQDKTFCPFTDCVKECERKLTKEVDREIKESGNPIIDVYTDKPECYTRLANGCRLMKCNLCYQPQNGYWYCPTCETEIAPCRVSNSEICVDCGSDVEYKKLKEA